MAQRTDGRGTGFYDAALARPEPPSQPSRAAFWTGWVLTALPSLFLLSGSIMAALRSPQVVEGTAKAGFPASFLPILAAVEFGCIVLYLIPRTAVLGALLLTAYFGGAVASHARTTPASKLSGDPGVGAGAVGCAGGVWGSGVGGVAAAAAWGAAVSPGGRITMDPMAENGIVRVRSRFSVAETVERLRGVLAGKGITLFALCWLHKGAQR